LQFVEKYARVSFVNTIKIARVRTDEFTIHTAILIKVVHEQSGKVEYERERLLGIAKKLMNFHDGQP
jgi:hypothetical protein